MERELKIKYTTWASIGIDPALMKEIKDMGAIRGNEKACQRLLIGFGAEGKT